MLPVHLILLLLLKLHSYYLFTQEMLAFLRSNFSIFLINYAWLGRKLIVRGKQRWLTRQMISCCFSA